MIVLPSFTYISYEPYIVGFDSPDGGFLGIPCSTLPEALFAYWMTEPHCGEPGEPVVRVIRDARGTVIFARDLRPGPLPLVATQEVLDLMRALTPDMGDATEQLEMMVRELYVLHRRET